MTEIAIVMALWAFGASVMWYRAAIRADNFRERYMADSLLHANRVATLAAIVRHGEKSKSGTAVKLARMAKEML